MRQTEIKQILKLIDLGEIDKLKEQLVEKLRYLEIKALKGGKGAADVKQFKKLIKNAPLLHLTGSFVKDGFQYFTDSRIGFRMNPGDFVTWLDDQSDVIEAEGTVSNLQSLFEKFPILDKSTLKVDVNRLLDLKDEDAYIFSNEQGEAVGVKAYYLRLALLVLGDKATVFLNGEGAPIRLSSRLGHCMIAPMKLA